MGDPGLSRRRTLAGAAIVGVGVPLLNACGSDDSPSQAELESTPEGTSGDVIASTSDVAVGACAVLTDAKLVITQPAEGEFKCFSAVCTHQGCLVSSGSDGEIPCTCHGSRFSLEDGSVLDGPATAPLPEVPITVEGDRITRA